MNDFSLTKWYLDAADAQGNVYIGYHVSVDWHSLEFQGYHHFWRTPTEGIHTRAGLTKQPLPVWENEKRLRWQPQHLSATWDTVDNGLEETLLSTGQGEIRWRCLQPKARAAIHLPTLSLSGWGYTECIEITIPVWELPIKRLLWGRSHSEHHTLVWISWDGSTKEHLLWHNGIREADWTITDHQLRGSDWQVNMSAMVPLRQGPLLSTVFQPYHHITQLFPKATFLVNEHKWYSLGQFESRAGCEPATLIYEEVLW